MSDSESKDHSGHDPSDPPQTTSDDSGRQQTDLDGTEDGMRAQLARHHAEFVATVKNYKDRAQVVTCGIVGITKDKLGMRVDRVILPQEVLPKPEPAILQGVDDDDDEPTAEDEITRQQRKIEERKLSEAQREQRKRARMRLRPPDGISPVLVEELKRMVMDETRARLMTEPEARKAALKRADEIQGWVCRAWETDRECAECGEESLYCWFLRESDGAPICEECVPKEQLLRTDYGRAHARYEALSELQVKLDRLQEDLADPLRDLEKLVKEAEGIEERLSTKRVKGPRNAAQQEALLITDIVSHAFSSLRTAYEAIGIATDSAANPDPIDTTELWRGPQYPDD